MSPANRATNVADELSHSRESMRAAAALVDLGLDRDAMSRLYYAIFHATLALLLTESIEPSTHRGVLSQLSLEFIKTARVPAELGATFRRIQAYREAADYTRGFTLPAGETRRELTAGRDYIAAVEAYLAAHGYATG